MTREEADSDTLYSSFKKERKAFKPLVIWADTVFEDCLVISPIAAGSKPSMYRRVTATR